MVAHLQIPKRKSYRLPGYDYSLAGAYFVTIIAKNRQCLFGNVTNGTMDINEVGKIITYAWQNLEKTYSYVFLDEYCLLPDHFHGILWIQELDPCGARSKINLAGPGMIKIKPLGQLIGSFKTCSTKQINLINNTPGEAIWQRNFYDRIVRDDKELDRIRTYIMANPSRWPDEPE